MHKWNNTDHIKSRKYIIITSICDTHWKLTTYNNFKVKSVNPYPHTDVFWRLCSRRLLKTLWQKEKLLITSNFSFCHNVFNSIEKSIFHLLTVLTVFQSRLLQNCCMWERVKVYIWLVHKTFIVDTSRKGGTYWICFHKMSPDTSLSAMTSGVAHLVLCRSNFLLCQHRES